MIHRQEGWLATYAGTELLMMSVDKGRYIALTEVGARIWELLEAPRSIEWLCAELCREFDVAPEVCRNEVETFCGTMAQHGAVWIDPSDESGGTPAR